MDDKIKIQIAIETLLEIHESDKLLKEMASVLGMGYFNECKGHVANTMRYLMAKRDGRVQPNDNHQPEQA